MSQGFFGTCRHQWRCFRADSAVYWSGRAGMGPLQSLLFALTCHGWHIMFLFRLGKVLYTFRIPLVAQLLRIGYQLVWFFFQTFYGIWISLSSQIGPGFYIGHFGAIVLQGNFGANCSVGQGVTVGSKGAGKSDGWPTVGTNVYIGAGAKIIGAIHVGDNVRIGANAVVIRDVPRDSLAIGVPAKVSPLRH